MAKRKVRQARHKAAAPKPSEQPEAETERPVDPDSAAAGQASRSRGKLLGAVAAMIVFVGAIVGVAAFAGGDGEETGYLDGVVVAYDDERLVLRLQEPVDGEEQIEMTIRDEDRETVDIEHLNYHQTQGDIFRIHYERIDDRYYAVAAEDIPGRAH